MKPVRGRLGRRLYPVAGLLLALNLFGALTAGAATREEQIAALKVEKNDAIFRVQHIVNQPVTRLKRTSDMIVAYYSPGWFHPGAITPDFDHVDVRRTRQLDYEANQYVTSDLNPGVVFPGRELEFNPMTKYFYTDRSVPKKKLTEAEMLEINRLYRIIGRCNRELDQLEHPKPKLVSTLALLSRNKPRVVEGMAAILVVLFLIRRMQSGRQEG